MATLRKKKKVVSLKKPGRPKMVEVKTRSGTKVMNEARAKKVLKKQRAAKTRAKNAMKSGGGLL